jgi:hypothetical protein
MDVFLAIAGELIFVSQAEKMGKWAIFCDLGLETLKQLKTPAVLVPPEGSHGRGKNRERFNPAALVSSERGHTAGLSANGFLLCL